MLNILVLSNNYTNKSPRFQAFPAISESSTHSIAFGISMPSEQTAARQPGTSLNRRAATERSGVTIVSPSRAKQSLLNDTSVFPTASESSL
jgi:hypothetical protein